MLTLSVALFLTIATVHLVAGIGTPLSLYVRRRGEPAAFMSVRTDDIYMKTDVEKLLESGRGPFARLRVVLMNVVGGLLVAISILELAVIWFGLRSGEPWALAALDRRRHRGPPLLDLGPLPLSKPRRSREPA